MLTALPLAMTLPKFKELYKSIGIELIVNVDNEKQQQFVTLSEGSYTYAEATKGFVGYMGFFSEITFDMNGKFIEQGFWE